MKPLICFGHRGACGYEPENTLISIEKGISLGASYIEIDVHAVEKELVVFHDIRLERTTNGVGFLADKPLSYLRSLDAGKGQKIPLLREVFDLVNRRARINIELKGLGTAYFVLLLIEEYVKNMNWVYDDFLISSFNHPDLKFIKTRQPQLKTGMLIEGIPLDYLKSARLLDAFSINQSRDFVTRDFVSDVHANGFKVFVYTANEADEILKMHELGVDGVFCDYPDRVVSFNNQLNDK